jgi:hypothetical protein
MPGLRYVGVILFHPSSLKGGSTSNRTPGHPSLQRLPHVGKMAATGEVADTQSMLGAIIKKPKLSDNLLNKPCVHSCRLEQSCGLGVHGAVAHCLQALPVPA